MPWNSTLTRKAGLPKRKHQISKTTATHRAGRADIQKATADWKAGTTYCLGCGTSQNIQRSHVLPQGMNKHLKANPLNMVPLCRDCHSIWTDSPAQFARLRPDAYAEKLRRMKLLDAGRYHLFLRKHPLPAGSPL